jgi:uncharacterized protein with gpF-like domain
MYPILDHLIRFKQHQNHNCNCKHNKKHYGFIAQDVQKIYPHLTETKIMGEYLTINYNELIPVMVKQIQNLKKELDSDYQSNFTLDNQTLMVSYNGKKVEIDIDKIGNHDYQYVFQNPITKQKVEVLTEGKRTDSENFYHVLVYYKKPSDRTHQLVACRGFNM